MSRSSGPTLHVASTRGRGPFDWIEAQIIYPLIAAGVAANESNLSIARRAGISDKTVARYRARLKAVNS